MGNFQGYLVKFGNDVFPHEYILYNTYKSTPDRIQDMDSHRNANGVLERNVLEHTATTLQFDIRPMNGDQQEVVQGFINSHLSDASQRKLYIEYWDVLKYAYNSGEFYLPDTDWWPIKRIEGNQIYYDKFTLKAIEY